MPEFEADTNIVSLLRRFEVQQAEHPNVIAHSIVRQRQSKAEAGGATKQTHGHPENTHDQAEQAHGLPQSPEYYNRRVKHLFLGLHASSDEITSHNPIQPASTTSNNETCGLIVSSQRPVPLLASTNELFRLSLERNYAKIPLPINNKHYSGNASKKP